MSTHITRKEALAVKAVIVLAAFACVVAFAPSADASRTTLRLDAALTRSDAPAEGTTGGTGGSNGGSSGGTSSSNENPQNVNVSEELAHDLLDEFIESGPNPQNFPNDDELSGNAEADVEDLEQAPPTVNFVTLLHLIISRFRSQ